MVTRKVIKPNQNLANSIYPIHFLGKCVGIIPYSLSIINNVRKPKTSKKDVFYIFTYFTIYLLMGAYTLRILYNNDKIFEIIPKFAALILTVTLISQVFLYILLCLVFRNLIINSYGRIDFLDESFKTIKIRMDYIGTKKFARKKGIIIILSSIIRTLFMMKIIHLDIIQQIMLLGAICVKSLTKNHFMILVLEIKCRYQKINEKIKTMFVTKTQGFQQDTNDHVMYIMKMLYILCRIHYKLRKIIQSIITAYSVQLLFYLGAALSGIIFQSYFLYVIITINDYKKTIFFIGSTLTWLIDEIYELYTLVDACASTCNTASETAIILHQLQNNIKNIDLENHVQMYSLQMLHQEIQFSVLGFVTIDYSLLYSIIGAVTTYLVILIQFNQAKVGVTTEPLINTTKMP